MTLGPWRTKKNGVYVAWHEEYICKWLDWEVLSRILQPLSGLEKAELLSRLSFQKNLTSSPAAGVQKLKVLCNWQRIDVCRSIESSNILFEELICSTARGWRPDVNICVQIPPYFNPSVLSVALKRKKNVHACEQTILLNHGAETGAFCISKSSLRVKGKLFSAIWSPSCFQDIAYVHQQTFDSSCSHSSCSVVQTSQ